MPVTQSRSALATIAALAAAVVALLSPGIPAAAATETAINEGQLEWSLKESWRKYIGTGSKVGGGAEVTGWLTKEDGEAYPEGFHFPVVSGSFDDETNTTILQLGGHVHFQSWEGLVEPGKFALDTKFSDLEIEISPQAQVLRGTHTGYDRSDPGGELYVDEDVVLAKFDISGAATSFATGVSKWSDVPTVAGPGFNIYTESTLLDPTSFEYAGPGGIPDLGEHWDTPGAPGLKSAGTWLADSASGARVLYPSADGELVHTVDLVGPKTTAAKLVIAAFDAETLEPVGAPYIWAFPGAVAADRQHLRTAFDPETGSLFFVTYHDGAARKEITVRRALWDAGAQAYTAEALGVLGSTFTNTRRVSALAWNPVKDELAAIAYSGSTADPYATDVLHRFRFESGAWTHRQTGLRAPDTGEWAGATSVTSPWGVSSSQETDEKSLAVARDGSYVSASKAGKAVVGGVDRHYPALHIVVDEEGGAIVTPIAGTKTPRVPLGVYYGFGSLTSDVNGSLLLHNSAQLMDAYVRVDVSGGVAATVGGIVDAPADILPPYELSLFASSMAADPERGFTWVTDPGDPDGYRLNALEGGETIGRYAYTDFPAAAAKGAYGRLAVGPDGSVYLPIQDSGSSRLGYRRLAYTGIVPAVTTQPQDRAVTVGVGEDSAPAGFAVAIADPGDSIQWQSKAAGETAFADLAGETGTGLAVVATPTADGTAYRAKVSNGAGAIVSATAILSVASAPRIVSDLGSRSVTEGADALFALSADGNPEPVVTWQRRVGGFWQGIDPGDDNFVVNGPSLTVLEANAEQSGALFRAKLTNSVASVFSKTAKLTVTPKVAIPDEGLDLENVSLEWTGNAEMQKAPPFGNSNFFSAGVSDGEEATYSAFADNAAVFQVSSAGVETSATWATRAAHVSSGGSQLVRLYGGDARIEPDGSATVAWDGAFSVNFYGGLVPFAFTDPELTIDAEGGGTLTAEMSGCASSQANPSECTPLAPVPDVTVATFSGVEVDPEGAVAIEPDYAGVEVTVPVPFAPQDRTVAGWGAWPQPFVDFQVETGLSSHWYSSGGTFDPYKQPDPFTVDFDGGELPEEPEPEPEEKPEPEEQPPAGDPPAKPPAAPAPSGELARIAKAGKVQALRGRQATVATLACPGDGFCAVNAPRRVKLKVGGRPSWARVAAPRIVEAGDTAAVKVRPAKPALRKLGRGTARGRLVVSVRSQSGTARQAIAMKIRKAKKKKAAGPKGVGGPESGPIGAPPGTLTRPATAVDVSGVQLTWYPRDSWVRYASSGVAPGDGILFANGATGTNSTASACPDRPSSSDAQLPYAIGFAPKASWYDPVSGSAGIYGQGSASFRWAAHSIDLTASDPEIEIAGAGSRAIFRFSGSGGTAYPDQRAPLVSLDAAGRPAVSNGGKTLTYDLMRGTLTPDGVNVFAGFYPPPDNDEFGCVTVQFSIP